MRMHRHVSRIWLAGAVLAVVVALALPGATPVAQAGLVDDDSLAEGLLTSAIGSFFGLDNGVVGAYCRDHRLSRSQVILAMYLARMAGVEPIRVMRFRSEGRGWGRIANDLGIHPGTFNKMRKGLPPGRSGDPALEDGALVWFLSTYYRVPQDDIVHWWNRGHPPTRIFVALDLAAKSGKPFGQLLAQRHNGKSWQAIAVEAGLSSSDLKHADKPKGGDVFRGYGGEQNEPPGKAKDGDSNGGKPGKPGGGPKGKH